MPESSAEAAGVPRDTTAKSPSTPAAGEVGAEASAEDRLAALTAECARLKDGWLRAEAELANFRRRATRDIEEAETRSRDRVLAEMISLADDLERALDAAEQAERTGPIYEGVHRVHRRVREILRQHGIEVVDPIGRPFDPFEAEALFQVDAEDAEPGTVVNVIAKGYRQGGRLLRPARVVVARAPETDETENEPS